MSTEPAVITVPTHVLEYLGEQMSMTLATASTTGVPHAATYMFVNVGPLLYFWTRPETTIAKQVAQNPVVAFTVDDYVEDWSKTKGVQGSGECRVILASAEIINVVRAFAEKYPNVHSGGETTNISFYRITPTQLQFIDNTDGGRSNEVLVDPLLDRSGLQRVQGPAAAGVARLHRRVAADQRRSR